MKTNIFMLLLFVFAIFCPVSGQFADGNPTGLIRLSHAYLRAEPKHSSELVTEAVMGTPVCVLEKSQNGWYHIVTPDGYCCYVHPESVCLFDEETLSAWRNRKRFIYVELEGYIYEDKSDKAPVVSDIFNGGIIMSDEDRGADKRWAAVILPDGRKGYIKRKEVHDFYYWSNIASQEDIRKSIDYIGMKMIGRTYLWGGCSYNVDCSGLTRVIYSANGILLPRDSGPQSKIGLQIPIDNKSSWQTGDLVFWADDSGKVNHVGVYLKEEGKYLQCAGRVRISSDQEEYTCHKPVVVRRIKGAGVEQGIIFFKDHPWLSLIHI